MKETRCGSAFGLVPGRDTCGERPTATRPLDGLRILLAEDDPDSLEALAELLEINGAEVRRCRDGLEARKALTRGFRPDLIISDLAMPVEDGFEMIAALRALPADDGGLVPAIAFSSVVDPALRDLALRSGFQDFVSKPIDVPLLLGRVAALIQRRGGNDGAVS
jgi:CheY-like chemotaxis protein